MYFKSSGCLVSVFDSVGGGMWGRKSRGWSGCRVFGFFGEFSLGEELGVIGVGDVEGVSVNFMGFVRDVVVVLFLDLFLLGFVFVGICSFWFSLGFLK